MSPESLGSFRPPEYLTEEASAVLPEEPKDRNKLLRIGHSIQYWQDRWTRHLMEISECGRFDLKTAWLWYHIGVRLFSPREPSKRRVLVNATVGAAVLGIAKSLADDATIGIVASAGAAGAWTLWRAGSR